MHLNVLNQALNVLQTLSFGGISITYTENNVELKMTVLLFGLTVIPRLFTSKWNRSLEPPR